MRAPEWVGHDFRGPSPWVRPGRPWFRWHDPGVPWTIRYPEISPGETLQRGTAGFLDNVAVETEGKQLTYREAGETSARLAAGLRSLGIGRGRAVALYTKNCPEFIAGAVGILRSGAACTPLNPLLGRGELEYVLGEAGVVDAIIVDEGLHRVVKGLTSPPKTVIVIGDGKGGDLSFRDFAAAHAPAPDAQVGPDDVAALVFTGGTTGRPKGVVLTQRNVLALVLTFTAHPRWAERRGQEPRLVFLPLCHIFGLSVVLGAYFSAHRIVLRDRFRPEEVLALIEERKPRIFGGVPTMYNMLLNHPDFGRRDLSSLEVCVSSADALPDEIDRLWHERTGIWPTQLYGMTECPGVTSTPPWVPRKAGTVGIPTLDTDVKIVDVETSAELPPGAVGEIAVRSPRVMAGYWRRPEETARVLRDGWYHTGDLGSMDAEGYLTVVGRKSDIIKHKGYKVFPEEIEEALYAHPAVLECAAVGIPDAAAGEVVKAFVSLKPEWRGKVRGEDLLAFARERLAPYKAPKAVELVALIPKTPIGKVWRKKLRERG